MVAQPEPVSYICGDCGQENTMKQGDVIQCRECGYRILYKKRTPNVILVECYRSKCVEARTIGDWKPTLKEADGAIAAGADSSP